MGIWQWLGHELWRWLELIASLSCSGISQDFDVDLIAEVAVVPVEECIICYRDLADCHMSRLPQWECKRHVYSNANHRSTCLLVTYSLICNHVFCLASECTPALGLGLLLSGPLDHLTLRESLLLL